MDMHPVKSSQIKEIGHDPATNTLAVRFKTGALYHYANFDAKKFGQFKSAESHGNFLGKHIKGQHDYTRIPEKKEK